MAEKNSAFDKTGSPVFELTRVFKAPLDLVWDVHSKKEHLAKWWGPKELDLTVLTLEFKVGGIFLFKMSAGDFEMWAKFVYQEITPKTLISFVLSFTDVNGNNTRQPGAPEWPVEILNEITFSEKDGETILKIRATPINATEEECQVYLGGFESMNGGFNGTFDQLDEYLAALQP